MASSRSKRTSLARIDAIGATGALLGVLVAVLGTFVTFRPNRVLLGEAATGLEAFGVAAVVLVALWLAAFVLAVLPTGRIGALTRAIVAATLAGTVLMLCAHAASRFAAATGELARVSFGASFWLSMLAVYFLAFGAYERLDAPLERAIAAAAAPLVVVVLLASGALDSLSIMKELAADPASFHTAVRQQLLYTLGATASASVLGVGLGVLSARRGVAEGAVFGTLNVTQVLPTLSFIGLLIVPIGWMGTHVPLLDSLGVSGIGWAPVFVVLVCYALFPITRNTHSALRTLDGGVVDAATGMGMGSARRFWTIELPLALPVIIAGIRLAAVQTTAAAIIAGMVGGGGLGAIVFFGLQQTAEDLVLLGVIPIVALALLFDAALRVIERLVSPHMEVSG